MSDCISGIFYHFGHQTEDTNSAHLRQFCRKSWTVGQLDKLDTPLFFLLKYYYH